MAIVSVASMLRDSLGAMVIAEDRTRIKDVHAGYTFRRPGERQTYYAETLVRNPKGCPGKTHINGACWDNCTPVTIVAIG